MEDSTSGGRDGGEGDVDEVDIIGVENAEEYGPGGYHPISKGDILGGRCDIRSFKFRLNLNLVTFEVFNLVFKIGFGFMLGQWDMLYFIQVSSEE